MKTRRKVLLTNAQIIALGFFLVILSGSILLMFPISSKDGSWTPFIDALFTATSATCVTGLVVFDTFTHWTVFGQIVILTLIQVGGIGLMTIVSGAYIRLNKRIGIQTRQLLMTSAGNLQLSGVVRLIKRILFGTLLFKSKKFEETYYGRNAMELKDKKDFVIVNLVKETNELTIVIASNVINSMDWNIIIEPLESGFFDNQILQLISTLKPIDKKDA